MHSLITLLKKEWQQFLDMPLLAKFWTVLGLVLTVVAFVSVTKTGSFPFPVVLP